MLVVELRRLAARVSLEEAAEWLLAEVQLVTVDRAALERASHLAPVDVRSLDAIHLDAAVSLHRDQQIAAVLTYDQQLQTGCAHHLLPTEAPAE